MDEIDFMQRIEDFKELFESKSLFHEEFAYVIIQDSFFFLVRSGIYSANPPTISLFGKKDFHEILENGILVIC
jgi:hypothetical protein